VQIPIQVGVDYSLCCSERILRSLLPAHWNWNPFPFSCVCRCVLAKQCTYYSIYEYAQKKKEEEEEEMIALHNKNRERSRGKLQSVSVLGWSAESVSPFSRSRYSAVPVHWTTGAHYSSGS